MEKTSIIAFFERLLSTKKALLFILAVFLIIAFYLFRDFNRIFFAQDEWLITGRLIHNVQRYGPVGFFVIIGNHIVPLAEGFWYLQYKLFGLNASYFAYTAVALHIIASFTLFIFFKKLLKSPLVAFLLAFLFLVHFNTTQALVWLAVYYSFVPSLIFTLLTLIQLQACFEKKSVSWVDSTVIFLLATIALSFHESATILLFIIPVFWFLFWPGVGKKKSFSQIAVITIFLTIFAGLRLLAQYFFGESFVLEQGNKLYMFLYNILTIPFKMIAQGIFSIYFLWDLARAYTRFAFPNFVKEGLMQEIVIYEHIVLLFSAIILLFILLLWIKSKKSFEKKIFFFSIAWIFSSALLIAPQGRHVYHLEFRYLYFASLGVLLFFFALFKAVVKTLKIPSLYTNIVILSAFLLYIISSSSILRSRLPYYYKQAETRESIISQILALYPKIPQNTIFYVTCKKNCQPDGLVLPFQSGVGQMLLVLYSQQNEKAYAPFLGEYFLWDWEAEDYRRIGEYGFGYFRDLSKIKKLVNERKAEPENVIALEYRRESNSIIDISSEIQTTLKSKL